MLCTKIVFCFCFDIQNNIFTQHVVILYFSGNSMNNLSSYFGLTDSRMRASEKDLPAPMMNNNSKLIIRRKLNYIKDNEIYLHINQLLIYFFYRWLVAKPLFSYIFAGQQQSFLGRRHLFWRRIVGFCQNVQSMGEVIVLKLIPIQRK